jgi:autotransporter-associated beta strand protein
MILTNSTAAEVGTSNVTAIASSTALFRQFMCYLSTTISTAITGTTGLIKNGIGGLTLSGICNYTGETQINAGTLAITNASTLNGVISGAGSLTKSGSFAVTVGGNNTYSGGTTLNGILTISNNNSFGTGTVTGSGTFDLRNIGSLLSLPNNFTSAGQMVFRIGVLTTLKILGSISGAGQVVKLGNGTLSLMGDLLTYTGSTAVNAGFIVVTKTVSASTVTATFQSAGISLFVSFDVAPPSGVTTIRFFQGATAQNYAAVTLSGVPFGTTATYTSATSTLSVIVP